MPYAFPQDIQQLVDDVMASGGFASEDELLRNALSDMQRRRADREAVRDGIAELEAGLGRPFEEFVREFSGQHGIPQG